MSFINYSAREIHCKIVYYGPGLCGKTTNLQFIYKRMNPEARGKMISLATETERTLFFDFLPLSLGEIRGFKTRFHLYTVPGQVFYDASRRLILRGVDGVVFCADSQRTPGGLGGTDLSPYDAVCLGSPYCRRVEGNYAEALDLLPAVVSRLHAAGKSAYVAPPAVPREADLPHVSRLVDAAAAAGADALEIHNMGVLRIVREKGRPVAAHMGAYANVYTHLAPGQREDHAAGAGC